MRSCFFRPRWLLVKLLITVPLVVLLLLNMQLTGQVKDLNSFYNLKQEAESFLKNKLAMYNTNSSNRFTQTVTSEKSSNSMVFDIVNGESYSAMIEKLNMTRDELRDRIEKANEQPVIRNRHFIDKYLQSTMSERKKLLNDSDKTYQVPEFLVILIQIHSRLSYLSDLVASLQQVKNIHNALVVFSHDIYDADMNAFVQSIDFCSVRLVTHQFSIRFHSDFV